MADEKILKRIKKLLALADPDANDSQAQVEAAAAKAAELIAKHCVPMNIIEDAQKTDGFVEKRWFVWKKSVHDGTLTNDHDEWLVELADDVAYAHYCKALFSPHGATFIGEEKNVDMALYVFEQLFHRLVKLSRAAMEEHNDRLREDGFKNPYHAWGHKHPRKWRRGWLVGCVAAIGHKLRKPRRDKFWEAFKNNDDDQTKALMVNHEGALSLYVEQTRPNIKSIDDYEQPSISAWGDGHDAGKNVSIRDGIKSAPSIRQLTGG